MYIKGRISHLFFLFRISTISNIHTGVYVSFILHLGLHLSQNIMLKQISLIFLALFAPYSFAQDDEMPASVDEVIKWEHSVEYEGDVATIVIVARQYDHWHIYAQEQPPLGISQGTELTFKPSDSYELIGKTREYGASEKDNDGYPEKIFDGSKATFKQKVKIKSKKDFVLNVEVYSMACKTVCFPPAYTDFDITVKGTNNLEDGVDEAVVLDEGGEPYEGDDPELTEDNVEVDSALVALLSTCEGSNYDEVFDPVIVRVFDAQRTDEKNYLLTVEIQIDSVFAMYAFDNPNGYKSVFSLKENDQVASAEDYSLTVSENTGTETKGYKYLATIKQEVSIKDTANVPNLEAALDIYLMGCENAFRNKEVMDLSFDLKDAIDNKVRSEEDSLWIIFILAFFGGFIALLTPCVFPMIPMTVSFFTKQSKTKAQGIRKAIFYAVCIIVIYVILGVLVAAIAGPTILNDMATNPWVNLVFFILFVVFAISFLGAFEITLPASWVNKADKQADRGGMIGIFFMAFTLALVSFSCTGPIVGSVLVQSASGGLSGPIVAMLGFSLALALPFGLFAAFPGWLNSLPSSGGWLNTVKVVLGFLELAFALKFLSNSDLVLQLHILERELFLGLWIGIFIVLAIYLLGKIQFPHDSPIEKLSVGRGILATLVVGFIIYLIPGMWGAPLKMISGFPPPMTYSESPYGIHGEAPKVPNGWPESTHPHGHDIYTVRDFEDAMEYAKEVDKPVLLDFTGWACVNCRKMEEYVWADPTVAPIMAEDFIVASLYVDDRTGLPAKYKGELKSNGDPMETTGDKWMKMQIEEYEQATQPMYVVLDHKGNNISGLADYSSHSEAELFKDWLNFAKKQFVSSKNATIITPEFVAL